MLSNDPESVFRGVFALAPGEHHEFRFECTIRVFFAFRRVPDDDEQVRGSPQWVAIIGRSAVHASERGAERTKPLAGFRAPRNRD